MGVCLCVAQFFRVLRRPRLGLREDTRFLKVAMKIERLSFAAVRGCSLMYRVKHSSIAIYIAMGISRLDLYTNLSSLGMLTVSKSRKSSPYDGGSPYESTMVLRKWDRLHVLRITVSFGRDGETILLIQSLKCVASNRRLIYLCKPR